MKTNLASVNSLVLYLTILSLVLCTSLPVQAQSNFQSISTGTDDYLFSIKQTADGTFISLGYTTSSVGFGSFDLLLIRSDQDGNYLWSKLFGGTNTDLGYDVEATDDGGFVLVGATQSYGAGGSDVLLMKVDGTGGLAWTKTFGGPNWDEGFDLEITNDGSFMIAGRTSSFGAGNGDMYVVKTTAAGELVWAKTYGGAGNEDARQVKQTADDGYIIVGHTLSFGAGNADTYLVKIDAAGEIEWTKTFGGGNFDYGNTIELTNDGGYIVSGNTLSFGQGQSDVYLLKLDNAGDVIWSKTYGGGNTENSYYVTQDAAGNYTISGLTNSFGAGGIDAFLLKANPAGEVIWAQTYGEEMDDFSNAVFLSAGDNFVFAGNSLSSAGQSRAYIVSADNAGNSGGCNQSESAFTAGNVSFQAGAGGTANAGGIVQNPVIMDGVAAIKDSIFCLTSEVAEIPESKSYSFYPNPVKQNAVLEFDNTTRQPHNFLLFDLQGRTLLNMANVTGSSIQIEKEDLLSGLYLFVLFTDDRMVGSGKVVIE